MILFIAALMLIVAFFMGVLGSKASIPLALSSFVLVIVWVFK